MVALLALFLAAPASLAAEEAGLVVEKVGEPSAAHRAGLRAGDVVRSWERAAAPPANPEPATGELTTPFDLAEVELEQASRGPVRVSGSREGEALSVVLPPGPWRIEAAPLFREPFRAAYEAGRRQLTSGDATGALAAWQELAGHLEEKDRRANAIWLRVRIAAGARERADHEAARRALEDSLRSAEAHGWTMARARLHEALGDAARDRGDVEGALREYRAALSLRTELRSESLAAAALRHRLGRLLFSKGDSEQGVAELRRALALREKLAPGSLVVSHSLSFMGYVATGLGDLEAAREHLERSLAIAAAHDPDGPDAATALYYRGILASYRDENIAADRDLRRALEIAERWEPELARRVLNSLAIVTKSRGDFAEAERLYRRALEGSGRDTRRGVVLINLAELEHLRADLTRAEEHYREALAIHEEAGGEPAYRAAALNGLGVVARARGDPSAAASHHRRALLMLESWAPESYQTCSTHGLLGEALRDGGDLDGAEEHFATAQRICEAILPRSVPASTMRLRLGELAERRGDLGGAEELFKKALAVFGELAPGTLDEAEAAYALGSLYRRSGRREEALRLLRRAADTLENQAVRLGGSQEVRAGFRARYAHFYQDLLDLLLDSGDPQAAFSLLERFRARVFLALLAERDLTFERDVPAELDARRRSADARYGSAIAELAQISAEKDAARKTELLARLEELRREQREIRDAIRAAAPRLADLRYPEPLDLAAARASLDAGTVLLSYSIGRERSHLFVVGPGPDALRVFPVASSLEDLRRRVEAFRGAIASRSSRARPLGTQLGRLLLEPAAAEIARAERLLVVPDGPLHLVPFAALPDPSRADRYLIESKALHTSYSATVFAEQKRLRARSRQGRFAAFGDPLYPAEGTETAAMGAGRAPGFRLTPLAATRREVEESGRLFGDEAVVFVGPEATEERARQVLPTASVAHFACHAVVDERFPLESSLALAIPGEVEAGQENGLLQAWEIFEELRVPADLVTLSACETGLGREIAGEGILGLTRAFHYAGARSVVASLWKVADWSTSELMVRFYRSLRAGQSTAEALSAAQRSLLREPIRVRSEGEADRRDASHPYHWAGFALFGDWR